jgi:hypothetical protein
MINQDQSGSIRSTWCVDRSNHEQSGAINSNQEQSGAIKSTWCVDRSRRNALVPLHAHAGHWSSGGVTDHVRHAGDASALGRA